MLRRRLIAAAPRLYHALLDLREIVEREIGDENLVRAIEREIAKADPEMRRWPVKSGK